MRKTFLPILLILSLAAGCIEVEISVPAFPNIANHFLVSEAYAQLTLAFNLVGFAISSIILGPISESYGRRIVMVVGIFIMLIGAYGCVFAPSIYWLYIARFIQGLGAATPAVIVFAIVSDAYKGEVAIKIISYFNAVFTILMAFSPIIGGFINQILGWRGNYAFVAIIINIAWIALLLFLPETNTNLKKLRLYVIFTNYSKLLTSKKFLSASTVPSLLYADYMAFIACSPFLYINNYKLTINQYAINMACIISTFAITSMYNNKIINQVGKNLSQLLSLVIITCGIVIMFLNTSILVTISMCLYCIGFAILYPIIFSQSLEIFPEIKGTASSAIMSMRTLLMTLLIAFSGLVYNNSSVNMALLFGLNTVIIAILTRYLHKV